MDYKKLDFEAIMDWCEANNQMDWLEAKTNETVKVEVYPYKEYTKKNGKVGRKYDKTQPATIVERPISFLLVKDAFVSKFMPEIKPEAADKPLSMRERVALRKGKK
jgi:hypothetical protein